LNSIQESERGAIRPSLT